ncbi:hypothetical protein LTR53_016455 [Teratosphaeriaceae sp. CCFEE 6253]|nr:hypothetical protein LTR53_016455 [Teratosphaeriaceae sp. CCFEE 6253]
MADNDLKLHALNPTTDFYALLSLPPSATPTQIRTAYRKTALKYHPDKVSAADTDARAKFELLQIANDVLSDPGVRELYDNARRAAEEKKAREGLLEGRRRGLVEELERREGMGVKRKREVGEAEAVFERELRRLAEDGKRRRKEREEALRREMETEAEAQRKEREGEPVAVPAPGDGIGGAGPTELDRSITLRYPTSAAARIDKDALIKVWGRFGAIQDCVLREKKAKKDGEKHKSPYVIAVLVYKSIVGAHAAISDIANLQHDEAGTWAVFEAVGWAGGKEPDHLPKSARAIPVPSATTATDLALDARSTPHISRQGNGDAARRGPSFASFKGTPAAGGTGMNGPSLDEITMMRLKNAERRRMEEKLRREDAAAAADTAAATPS